MKKVLVTGAAGTIGINVIEKLIEADKYEITVLDLKSLKAVRRFKNYLNQINVLYGDINDERLMDALVKGHDVIIHLAGVIPPFADIKTNLAKVVDYEGTKTLIRAINDYNQKCFLIYASSTTLYGDNKNSVDVNNKIVVDPDDLYAMAKLRCEERIKEGIKNYTIFRLPAVLGDLKLDAPMYNIPLDSKVEFIMAESAAEAFVRAIEFKTKLNKKIFNVSGGSKWRTNFKDFLYHVFKTYGISIRYIATSLFVDKNFYSSYYSDGEVVEDILKFRESSLEEFYKNIRRKYKGRKRFFPRMLMKPFLFIFK